MSDSKFDMGNRKHWPNLTKLKQEDDASLMFRAMTKMLHDAEAMSAKIKRLERALEKCRSQRDIYSKKYWATMDVTDEVSREIDEAEIEAILKGEAEGE